MRLEMPHMAVSKEQVGRPSSPILVPGVHPAVSPRPDPEDSAGRAPSRPASMTGSTARVPCVPLFPAAVRHDRPGAFGTPGWGAI